MRARTHVAKILFTVCGIWLVGLGVYFMSVRPALLPEDLRYMGTTLRDIRSVAPGLLGWLGRVFTVMGGFMTGFGSLTILVALNLARFRGAIAFAVLAITGALTVGTMSLTNFRLDSDFKWLLLVPAVAWAIGIVLYQREG